MSSGLPKIAHLERVSDVDGALYAWPDCAAQILDAGLDRSESWTLRLQRGAPGPGRGHTARVELGAQVVARLKQMRRGGLLGPLWRNRYLGQRRLVHSVEVAEVLRARGVPTARPLALLLVPGPPALFRAWIAHRELQDTRDLKTIQGSDHPLEPQDWETVLGAIRRMHDLGVDHRDLNLGNILLGDRGSKPRVWFIDLDRTRVYRDPVPLARRRQALWRLERSLEKQRHGAAAGRGTNPIAGYEGYAAGSESLIRQLGRGSWLARGLLAAHRAFWR